jgi:16S rRNA (uracil1498-N3)-methyltransferase
MHRFFVQPETITGQEARIASEVAHQISRVLRMQQGDEICLLDGSGYEYRVRLVSIGANECVGRVIERVKGDAEPRCKVTLYISLLNKADKFEWALQKCTELGAVRFVPVRSARSISDAPGRTKTERWERIIQEAAEQSGRAIIPTLEDAISLQAAFQQESAALRSAQDGEHIALIPALGAQVTLKAALRSAEGAGTVAIFIGPEGGFAPSEVEEAKAAGVAPVTLGPRTLRAETAAVAALTMALYEMGEMELLENVGQLAEELEDEGQA